MRISADDVVVDEFGGMEEGSTTPGVAAAGGATAAVGAAGGQSQGQEGAVASDIDGNGSWCCEGMEEQRVKVIFTIPPRQVNTCDPYACLSRYKALRLIPVSPVSDIGRYYKWDEIKLQVLKLNAFAETTGLRFVLRLTNGIEYVVNSETEFRSVLKIAETSDESLDVVIEDTLDSDSDNEVVADMADKKASNRITLRIDSDTEDKSDVDYILISNRGKCGGRHPPKKDDNTISSLEQNAATSAPATADQAHNQMFSTDALNQVKSQIEKSVTRNIVAKLIESLKTFDIEEQLQQDLPQSICPREHDVRTNSTVGQNSPPILSASPKSFVESGCPVLQPASGADADKGQLHPHIVCDNCEGEVRGIRYKCSVCVDYDLCSKCEGIPNTHDEAHSFLKMRKPAQRNSRDICLSLDIDLPTGVIKKYSSDRKLDIDLSDIVQACRSSFLSTSRGAPFSSAPASEYPASSSSADKSQAKPSCAGAMAATDSSAEKREKSSDAEPRSSKKTRGHVSIMQARKPIKVSRQGLDADSSFNPLVLESTKHSKSSSKILYLSGMFVADETVPCGTKMPPGAKFKKVWRVRNTGTKAWNSRTVLKYCWGNGDLEPQGKVKEVPVPPLKPWQEGRITVRFTAPKTPGFGFYQSHWRLHHRGQPFGQRMICTISVDPKATISDQRNEERKHKSAYGSSSEGKQQKTPVLDALSAVRAIRFAEECQPIPTTVDPKSSTQTPANTPFAMSPPKTPEPLFENERTGQLMDTGVYDPKGSASNNCGQNSALDRRHCSAVHVTAVDSVPNGSRKFSQPDSEFGGHYYNAFPQAVDFVRTEPQILTQRFLPPNCEASYKESKQSFGTTEKEGCLADVDPTRAISQRSETSLRSTLLSPLRDNLSMLSPSSSESADEFVVVQLPPCFDLDSPFAEDVMPKAKKEAQESIADMYGSSSSQHDNSNRVDQQSHDDKCANAIFEEARWAHQVKSSFEVDTLEEQMSQLAIQQGLIDFPHYSSSSSSATDSPLASDLELIDELVSGFSDDDEEAKKINSVEEKPLSEQCVQLEPNEELKSAFSCISSQPTLSSDEGVPTAIQRNDGLTFGYAPLPQHGSTDSSAQSFSFASFNEPNHGAKIVQSDSNEEEQAAGATGITSTNPFLNTQQQVGNNVIHVLPESIVSAATHVLENVSKALFTSPQEANLGMSAGALTVHTRGPSRASQQPISTGDVASDVSGPLENPAGWQSEPSTHSNLLLDSAMAQLFEMGFWNRELNKKLLEKNESDVSNTVEELLRPGTTSLANPSGSQQDEHGEVVLSQPRQQQPGSFIYEFD